MRNVGEGDMPGKPGDKSPSASRPRRRAVVAALAVGAPMAALFTVAEAGRPRGVRALALRVLEERSLGVRIARQVAPSYLADGPAAQASATRLAARLSSALRRSPPAAAAEIAAQLESAWKTADVVVAGGWVLARTEADLCVIALGKV